MLKKGQAGAGQAMVLIAVIGLILILYIVALPPGERVKVLEGEQVTEAKPLGSSQLLQVSPGRIHFLAEREITHALPSSALSTKIRSQEIVQKPAVTVKNSLFSFREANLSFSITPELTKQVMLSFAVEKAQGPLRVLVNDEEFIEQEITSSNAGPFTIPAQLLRDENTVIFQTTSPGFAFWRTNQYDLRNVLITGDIEDREARKSRNIFLISGEEKDNLNRVRLAYFPECSEPGKLHIWINNRNIFSGNSPCNVRQTVLEFDINHLILGENVLEFDLESGEIFLENVKVISELAKIDYPSFYFELGKEDFDKVEARRKKLILELHFTDFSEQKHGELIVNGKIVPFNTRDLSLTVDVSSRIVRGNNAIKIRPFKTLDVRELTVSLG